ncbi:choice-of-anchor J domain-containing protein [Flavobacterium sp. WW92]|uniref:choice-of-anchor J domain-containing protein n=1 Tax=unclassified Flavobacterium TaxID=196869 RepID=UPI00222584E0|nr:MULTISPECIES: choice-of-anchor J domain-containing protein [unclassified Flavobacterium]WDO13750.1 choice-of-anchor J domain-containing protein [Flavobacterium sp. WW92]
MKKITLLLLTFFMSLVTFGQGLTENFDGGTTSALPSGWTDFNNAQGTPRRWLVNTQPNFSASAPNSAFIQNYQAGQGNTSRDWLVTPPITLPENAQLQFLTRAFLNDNQGTIYEIRVSRNVANPNPNDVSSYTLAEDWTELELNPTGIYEENGTTPRWDEKTVNLKALGYNAGEAVRIAFVRVHAQTTPGIGGDRWYIDDVRVSRKCDTPTNLQAPTINMTNALLTWTTPTGGATQWEIVIVPETMTLEQGIAAGLIHTVNGPMPPPYNTSPDFTLNPDTNYKYYVRAVCSPTNKSDWTTPYFFTTASLGETCADPIVMPGIPYSTTNNTTNSNDRTDVAQGTGCGAVPAGTNYMTGNEVFYSFVAPTSGDIRVEMTPTAPNSGVFVYSSCANVGVSCVAGAANTNSTTRIVTLLSVTAGQTYIVVVSSTSANQTIGYYLELQYITCDEPTALAASNITQTQATLSWGNVPGYTEWQVAIQPAGSAIPAVGSPSQTVTTNTGHVFTQMADGTALTGSTSYQYWVRALCVAGGSTYSPWAGPFEFFTPICNPDPTTSSPCNHNFRLTGTNGWQGAVMHVRQNGITVKVLGPQFTSGTSLVVPVPLCHGIPFELVWVTGGTAPATVGVVVQNSFGQLLYQKTAGTGAPGTAPLHTEMVDCEFPKCPVPINLGATGITANGATLTWTPASLPSGPTTDWEIYLSPQESAVVPLNTDPINLANVTSTRPNPRTGLISDTPYVFYIRTVCGPNRASLWVGPFSFRTAVSCGIPTNLNASDIRTTSAVLGWTQPALGAASSWQVVVQAPGGDVPTYNDPAAVTIANGGAYGTGVPGAVGTALQAATQYEFYVRAVCSGTDVSRWVGPFLFNTACDPLAVPYSEGFNSTSPRQLCWSTLSVSGTNTWNMNDTATPFEGNEVATFTPNAGTNNDDWLISPVLDLRTGYRIRYKYKVASATAANTLEVVLSNGGSIAPANFNTTTPLWRGTLTNTEYRERIINLVGEGGPPGTLVNIAFHIPQGANSQTKIFIDDVVIEPIPACPDPMDLGIVAGSITSTSAQLFWTPGYQETQWQVAVQPVGTGVPSATFAGAVTTNNINFLANTNTVTGAPLQPGNQYEYYVRAVCADPNVSQWVGPIVFRTLLCETADLCAYTFRLTDTASNGWGADVTMSVMQNGLLVATLTGPPAGVTFVDQVVNFCPGVQFEVLWNPSTAGTANLGQVGLTITNFYNEQIYTKPPGTGRPNSRLYRGMPFCSAITCPYPTNLTVEQTSASSANISWTPGGTETAWEYVHQAAGGPYPGSIPGTRVTVPNANLTGIPPTVPQEYYVRAICGPDNVSYWSGPYEFTLYNSPGCIGVDIEGITMSLGEEKILCPDDLCIDLSATYFQTQATTRYRVERIDYAPPFPLVGAPGSIVLPITVDDDWSPLVDLTLLSDSTGQSRPFNFCFFGDAYSKLLVTDNGAITFSISGPTGNGGMYEPGSPNAGYQLFPASTIPLIPAMANTTTLPYRNSISGVLQDLWPERSPADASINYTVLGTAPCRAFVLNIYKMASYSTACTNLLQTSQIVLYEGSNMIDVYVEKRTPCPGWQGGLGVIGIQGDTNTEFAVPPGRNTGNWTAENEAWRFIPDGDLSNVVFKWLKDGEFYSNDLDINVCIEDVSLMQAVALYDKCDGTSVERKAEVKLIKDVFPENEPEDLKACTGTTTQFDVTVNTDVILDGLENPDDYVITYYLTLPEAEDGTTGAVTSVTTTVDVPVYVRIDKPSTGCHIITDFNIKPNNPLPAYTVDGDMIICEGDSTTATVVPTNFNLADGTYTWTLPDGTVSDQTGSTFNITPANTQEGTYSVKVSNGCEETVEFVLQVNEIDTDFTYETPVCPTGTITPELTDALAFTVGGAYTISPALPIDATTGEVTLDGAAAGDYVVTYTVTPAITNCTDDKTGAFTFTVTGGVTPGTAFTYPQDEYCITDPSPIAVIPGVGYTAGGTFTATPSTGLGLDATTGAIDFTTSTAGLYRVFYTIEEDEALCRAYSQSFFDIRINPSGTATTGFTYTTPVCISGTNPMPIPVSGFVTGGTYSLVAGTGVVFDPTTGEIDLATSQPGTYTIKYTVAASGCGLGGNTDATIVINALTQPAVAFSYATPVCKNATVNPMPVPGAGFVTGGQYTSTDPNVSVNLTTGEINLANSQIGTYTITYSVPQDNGLCRDAGSFDTTITITTAINPVTDFAYSDDSFCSSGTQGSIPTGGFTPGGQFTANPSTGLSLNPNTGEIIAGTSAPGTYVVTYLITADPATCRNRSESSFTVTIENQLDITFANECQNNEYVLIASPSDPSYTYVWRNAQNEQVGTNSSTFNVSQYVATLSGEVQYPLNFTVTIITATGCESVKPVEVSSTFCDIQKGISPNNDGNNETFDLTGFNVKKLTIFNRYGTEVYSFTNYTNQWRGQSSGGKELPDGTYYYVIERSGVSSKTGWIQINRERN